MFEKTGSSETTVFVSGKSDATLDQHELTPENMAPIETIIHGITPEAKLCLISLLGEMLNTWHNLSEFCSAKPMCNQFLSMRRATVLLDALNQNCIADPDEAGFHPSATNRIA